MSKKLEYSDRFWDILIEINKKEEKISTAFMEVSGLSVAPGDISFVDVSKNSPYLFEVNIDGKKETIKIGTYIRTYFPNMFTSEEINAFIVAFYSQMTGISPKFSKKGEFIETKSNFTKVEVPKFQFNPKDVRSTFISLVTETYPHGHEEEVVPLISQIGLSKDKFGNYYKIVGKSETMFTSHLDTVDRNKSKVTIYSEKNGGDEILSSDGSTILGADDKSGVSVMLYMISNNVPGLYYFFIGEERGGIGSRELSFEFDKFDYLKNIKRCVSFDRRNYFSVITEQLGGVCCSNDFANALCRELNKSGLSVKIDPTGIFTDSASFIEQIQECTNISVGYFNEHTTKEKQNITFLDKLAKACIKVDWEKLPTVRKIGIDDDILILFKDFLDDLKKSGLSMEQKLIVIRRDSYLKLDLIGVDYESFRSDIEILSYLIDKHRLDLDISFDDDTILIELSDHLSKWASMYRFGRDSRSSGIWESTELDDLDSDYESEEADDDAYAEFDYEEDEFSKGHASEKEGDIDNNLVELTYWLRKMFLSNKLEAQVESDDIELVTVYIPFNTVENIDKLVKIVQVVDKIKEELLTGYSVDFEIYETRKRSCVMRVEFYWNN